MLNIRRLLLKRKEKRIKNSILSLIFAVEGVDIDYVEISLVKDENGNFTGAFSAGNLYTAIILCGRSVDPINLIGVSEYMFDDGLIVGFDNGAAYIRMYNGIDELFETRLN